VKEATMHALMVMAAMSAGPPGGGGEASPEPAPPKITAANLAKLRELHTLDREAWRIVARPDGRRLAFVRWERPTELVDPARLRPVGTAGKGKVIGFAFGAGGVTAYSTNGGGAFLVPPGKEEIRLDVGADQAGLAFSPDGKLLVTAGYHSGAKVWDAKTGRLLRTLDTGPVQGGLTAVFSPDGKTLAVGNRNSTARLFDPATGKLLHTLGRQMSHGLAFSPDGKSLAIVYVDASVVLWDVATGKVRPEAKTGVPELFSVCWSPDGGLLVTGGLRAPVTVWSAKGLKTLKELKAPEAVFTLRFTPDGSRLLAGGGDQRAGGERKVWVWGLK
jgi:hypothetical protein